MDNLEISKFYALAKTMGCDKSFDDFKEEYSRYFSEIRKELASRPPELAKIEVIDNPFKTKR